MDRRTAQVVRVHGSRSTKCSSSQPRFSIFTTLIILVSLVSMVCASVDQNQASVERRRSFADLGARRLMERAAQVTGEEEESATTTTTPEAPESSFTAAPTATETTLPQPFDTTLGNNFTSESCPRFFTEFLSDETFRSCYPFSLLLQTSHGFFEAEKNFFQTTRALEASCFANYDVCNTLMQSLATQIKSASNCMTDFNAENQIVMQAYKGLLAYPVMYQAACLQNSEGDYCKYLPIPSQFHKTNSFSGFANAITVRSNASMADAYSYYLPLGQSMPVGNRPSCSDCLKKTMAIYRSYASNATQPLSTTYVAAAQQVNMACGPDWVSDVVEATTSAASSSRLASSASLLVPFLATLLMLF